MIVQNHKVFVTYVEDVFFYPGMNQLTDAQAKKIATHPDFVARVKAGQLSVLNPTAEVINVALSKPAALKIATKVAITSMDVTSATKVINSLFNKAELLKLKETDQRMGIQSAIARQIKKIDAAGEVEVGSEG